jgi:hypothetical protein
MITATITNKTGALTVTGWLPGTLSWIPGIANNATVDVVLNVQDLSNPIPHLGFSLGELLQQMVNKGFITVSFANVATDTDVTSLAIAGETS